MRGNANFLFNYIPNNFFPYSLRHSSEVNNLVVDWLSSISPPNIPLSREQSDFHCNSAGSRPIKINHLSRIIIRLFAGNMTTSTCFVVFLTFAAMLQTHSFYLPRRVSIAIENLLALVVHVLTIPYAGITTRAKVNETNV